MAGRNVRKYFFISNTAGKSAKIFLFNDENDEEKIMALKATKIS